MDKNVERSNSRALFVFFGIMAAMMIVPMDAMAGSGLSGVANTMKTDIGASSKTFMEIMGLVGKIVGFAFAAWGIYDLFIAEDPQKQGKKSQGGMKIAGGAMLMALSASVAWFGGK